MGFDTTYTDHLAIMARIARRHKSLVLNENDILEWCQEVEMDILSNVDMMYKYIEFPLEVKGGRAKLPCNCYRIIDVYTSPGDDASRIPFGKLKGYITLDPTKNYSNIYIDFYGLPIDLNTGIPLIIAGHEAACEAYCVHSLYLDDIYNNRIPGNVAGLIIQTMQSEIMAAAGSHNIRHKTREDLNRSNAIAFNMIPKVIGFDLINGRY